MKTNSDDSNKGDDQAITDPNIMNFMNNLSAECDHKAMALATYKKLPQNVKRRVNAVRKLQFDLFSVEAAFFKRMNDLEREFESQYGELYEKRRQIVCGEHEPTAEECEFENDIDDGTEEEGGENGTNGADEKEAESGPGIPSYWLTVFKNIPILTEHSEETDHDLLKHLTDVTCAIHLPSEKPGFQLSFHFSPNDYFTDTVLKKDYFVRFEPSSDDPLGYEGPEIIESKGCIIHWKSGKDLTVRVVKKTMKAKKGGEKKTVTKTVKTNSFFNFFNPPKGSIEDVDDEGEDDVVGEMQADYELGQFVREQLIPRSVLFFTGEGIEEEEEDFDEEEDDSDAEEGEMGAGDEESGHKRGKGGHGKGGEGDCKQQ